MSTKAKTFIGLTISFIVLLILFTSTGGHRANISNEQTKTVTSSAE